MSLVMGLIAAGPVPAAVASSTEESAAQEYSAEFALVDRGHVVDYWKEGGPGVRAAAEAALIGTDADVQKFLAAADDLEFQDDRVGAAQLASVGGTELLAAARRALAGSPEELDTFLATGWQGPLEQDQRVLVAQVIATAGPNVQAAGRAALQGTADDVRKFLSEGQYAQQAQDDRVQVAQIISAGGANVLAAGRLALRGTTEDIREFLEVGQYVARSRDQENSTVAQLAEQAKEAGRQAAKETDAAKAESANAVEAAQLAKEAAQRAAREAEAAKTDTAAAGRAANRAAKAASQAAQAAQKAIDSARAANSSARIAANAASQAAAAAAGASQAASEAQNAAAAAATDASKADAARKAAGTARAAAEGADKASEAANQAANAATAAGDAAKSAISAGANANAAANAAVEASAYSDQSSAAAVQARAAAAATKRHAAEANRAAAAAEALARKAATAAGQARDSAKSAAVHARNAAQAADDAADHAGEAATAAAKSTAHANAATSAANTAVDAVAKARTVFKLAREIETEELLGRTNAGIERVKDLKAEDEERTAAQAKLEQGVKDRDAERDRLVGEAAQAGADLQQVANQGRELAVSTMKNGTSWGRAAAEAALAGPDEVVIDWLRNGWKNAQEQENRSYIERLAEESAVKEVRDAAEAALKGDAAAVADFVDNGQYEVGSEPMRVEIAQIISQAGPVLAEAGRAALSSGDPKQYSKFITETQNAKRTEDERVKAAQLHASGGPEVQSAARIALAGPPQALHAFIASGQFTAQRKDELAATHVAQVQQMIFGAAKIAAKAQQNAAEAQKVAATARKAATEAADWAKKAEDSADEAKEYAEQADQYAKDAETSAAKAAESARTARKAANSADAAAADAARSATDATLSAEKAQASASTAWYYSEQARQSSVAAGKSAEAALKDADAAFNTAIAKAKEELEAERKAAVAAKEKEINDNGARAREMYRCGFAYLPCDPQKFARWCQQNDIYCRIYSDGPGYFEALRPLWKITAELTGIGNLQTCLDNQDLANCGPLVAEALIGAKLKSLEKAYDGLKLLKRTCTKCFPAGTKVRMGDGSNENIEDVQPGDKVLATNPETGYTAVREVVRQIVTQDDKHFNELTIATRAGPQTLTATEEHPFWSPSQHQWVEAGALKPGMDLLSNDKSTVRVQENRSYAQRRTTYNLTVANIHTYYVLAGTTPVLVHNASGLCGVEALENGDWKHILDRHRPGGALVDPEAGILIGKEKVVRQRIADAINRGTPKKNTPDPKTQEPRPGFLYDWDFGFPVGRQGPKNGGGPLTTIRVVVNEGKVVTAFPI
ncbi:polymorphic toxin-type HINT domain-containing protein [Streptomyces sp. NPDC046939]|uniref:polymorphic toxin-type HINT domain-containing protein n=1 Tax=Streptomyces sp. NPDC046939 TaxID=3155376 RepID=UPI0033EE4454